MNDVDYRAKELKRIGRGAAHMSRRGKGAVHLPQDYMTKREMTKMNGDCMAYDMSKPMDYEQFKGMPSDLQVEYLNKIRKEYGAGLRPLAAMMGTSGVTLREYLKRRDLDLVKVKTGSMDKETLKRWNEFIGVAEEEPDVEVENTPIEEPTPVKDDSRPSVMSIETELTGEWNAILRYLYAFPVMADRNIRVSVRIEPA